MSCSVNPDVLRTQFQSAIIQYLHLPTIIPPLSEAGLISKEEQKKLLHSSTGQVEKIQNLVLWLGEKPDSVNRLLDCLRGAEDHRGHATLVEEIEAGLRGYSLSSATSTDQTLQCSHSETSKHPSPNGTEEVAPPPKRHALHQHYPYDYTEDGHMLISATPQALSSAQLPPSAQHSPGATASGYRSVLVKHNEDCTTLIDLTSLIPHLNQHCLLTRDEQERLNNRQLYVNETSRAKALVEVILRKGDVGLQCFLDALQEEKEHIGHVELYQKLTFNQQTASQPMHMLIKRLRDAYPESAVLYRSTGPKLNVAKYIDLALIGKRGMPRNDKEAYRYTMKTIHGTVDDIPQYCKDPVEVKNIFKYKGKSVKKVLVEGAPGIGKTVLAAYMCSEWAKGQLLNEYDCVILVYLREFQNSADREFDVIDFVKKYLPRERGIQASEAIEELHGKGTLIILEGWDELPPELRDEGSFFSKIISGVVLPECSIMVTSRPSVSSQLYHLCSRRIEILGFTNEKIRKYVQEHASEKKDVILTYLRNHPNIQRFAHVPQTLSIICEILRNTDELPLTLTELYDVYIRNKITFNLRKHPKFKHMNIFHPRRLVDLPSSAQFVLDALSKLALDNVMQRKIVFQARDLSKAGIKIEEDETFDGYGLLHSFPCYAGAVYEINYHFQHLTVQEYMAAYQFSRLCQQKQIEIMEKFREDPQFEVVLKFISGITRLKEKSLQDFVIDKSKKESNKDQVLLLHCLLEAQNVSLISRAAEWLDHQLYLSNHLLSPTDLLAIAHLIGQAAGKWCLRLRGCAVSGEGLNILHHHLKEIQSKAKKSQPKKEAMPLTISTLDLAGDSTCLDMSSESDSPGDLVLTKFISADIGVKVIEIDISHSNNKKFGDERTFHLAHALHNNKHVKLLKMSYCSITEVGGKYLADMLRRNESLIELFMRWNELGDRGVSHLASALQKNNTLESLSIGNNKIGMEGWTNICEMLKRNKKLKCIRIESSSDGTHHIGPEGCTVLVETLSRNVTLTRIDFLKNPLCDSGVGIIANGILANPCCVLRHLGLFGCGLTDEGVKSICRLAEADRLKGVQLGSNKSITDVGAELLMKSLESSTSLKQIRLEKTSISKEQMQQMKISYSSVEITCIDNPHMLRLLKEKRTHTSIASYSSF